MSQPIVEVDHVTREFILGRPPSLRQTTVDFLSRLAGRPVEAPKPFKALDDVSFSVAPGEVLGIIGHNGAGKSTLLKLLARISVPTTGRIAVRGRVAPLIEVGAGLVQEMTGRENIFVNASILGMKKAEIRRRFDEIVSFAEIEEFIDTPIKRYSSGMQVKLGFSIATSVAAEILIVDEVLAVGDLSFQQKCIERMEQLIRGDGRTVLIVGHNIRQIQRICSRVMLLDHGRITQDGAPQDVCGILFRESQERNLGRRTKGAGRIAAERDAGVIEVEGVELFDDNGTRTEKFVMHAPMNVRVRFVCKQPVSRCEIVIGLHTSDFVHVLSVGNIMAENIPDLDAGPHELTCRIEEIPVRPFTYGLRLAFLDQYRSTLWNAENIASVTVMPGDIDALKLPASGFVNPASRWRFATRDSTDSRFELGRVFYVGEA